VSFLGGFCFISMVLVLQPAGGAAYAQRSPATRAADVVCFLFFLVTSQVDQTRARR
jgi:hypothetical protein